MDEYVHRTVSSTNCTCDEHVNARVQQETKTGRLPVSGYVVFALSCVRAHPINGDETIRLWSPHFALNAALQFSFMCCGGIRVSVSLVGKTHPTRPQERQREGGGKERGDYRRHHH